jgi:hypothetical protein
MCEDFVQPFGNNALSHTSFFTREYLTKNNKTIALYPPYFSLVPELKIELKGRHFDTKWQKRWGWCIRVEGDYFEGDGGQYA